MYAKWYFFTMITAVVVAFCIVLVKFYRANFIVTSALNYSCFSCSKLFTFRKLFIPLQQSESSNLDCLTLKN